MIAGLSFLSINLPTTLCVALKALGSTLNSPNVVPFVAFFHGEKGQGCKKHYWRRRRQVRCVSVILLDFQTKRGVLSYL